MEVLEDEEQFKSKSKGRSKSKRSKKSDPYATNIIPLTPVPLEEIIESEPELDGKIEESVAEPVAVSEPVALEEEQREEVDLNKTLSIEPQPQPVATVEPIPAVEPADVVEQPVVPVQAEESKHEEVAKHKTEVVSIGGRTKVIEYEEPPLPQGVLKPRLASRPKDERGYTGVSAFNQHRISVGEREYLQPDDAPEGQNKSGKKQKVPFLRASSGMPHAPSLKLQPGILRSQKKIKKTDDK